MRWPTSCRPSGAARPSTRRLRPWGRRGGGTPEPPRPLAGSPWTSSRVGGRSRAGRLRNRAASGPFVSPWRSRNSCASAQNVKCITSNYGNCISPADGLAVRKNYANEVGLEGKEGGGWWWGAWMPRRKKLLQPLSIYSSIFCDGGASVPQCTHDICLAFTSIHHI